MKKPSRKRLLSIAAVLVAGLLAHQLGGDRTSFAPAGALPSTQSRPPAADLASPSEPAGIGAGIAAAERIEDAYADRRSGFMVTVEARVVKSLPDDLDGSRHQRFLIELASGRTLLVAHNIDLAARVPLDRGDAVRVRGQYEWNERGGVLHWTHADPRGRHEGGWIEHEGRRTGARQR